MAAREVNYVVEYAKTNRSSCAKSKATIPAGGLRIGRNSPSPFHDGYITKWFLPKPFFQRYGGEVKSASQLAGLAALRPDDQAKLRLLAGEKDVKPVETTPDIENLWAVKDYLKNLSLKELKANLEFNGASSQGGQDTLIDRVADGLVFGRATCATCGTPDQCQLKYYDGYFKCKTELTWGTCGYEGTDVVIHQWKRNTEFEDDEFISKLSKEPASRPLKKVVKKIGVYRRDPKRPLKGMKFHILGNIGIDHQELTDHIRRHGGVVVPAVGPEIDYVISTYPTFMGDRPLVQKAKEYNLAFVSSLLVNRLIAEFGFDQSPYLLGGQLPQIAFAKLESNTPDPETTDKKNDEAQLPHGKTIHPEAKAPNGKICARDGISYDVVMTMTDIKDGSNKYYILQIIDFDGTGKVFTCFRKWGRVGTTVGGAMSSSPSGFKTALEIFKEQYYDKSGIEWDQRATGTKQPGKYFPFSLDNSEEPEESLVDDSLPSYLDPKVRDLVDSIFDTDMMTRDLKSLEVDVRKMPLGKLTKEQISKGYQVLTDIEKILNSHEPSEVQLATLSSQFYTLIPTDFGKKSVQVIDSFNTLTSKMRQLEALVELQIASSLLKEETLVGVHPADQNYKKLGAILKPLSDFSRDFKMVKRYIDNGYDPVKLGYKIKLENLYSVSRTGERNEFAQFKQVRPRKLLWHGSRMCNFVGILNQGLRIAPPEAPTTGYLFGKGIYFADRIAKSAPFCQPSKSNTRGLLVLCDVALGDAYEVKKPEYITQLPEGKTHTLVLAKKIPDPAKVELSEDQVIVPSGPAIPTNHTDVFVEDQEYVVYSRQLMIKYLVQVKFEFPN